MVFKVAFDCTTRLRGVLAFDFYALGAERRVKSGDKQQRMVHNFRRGGGAGRRGGAPIREELAGEGINVQKLISVLTAAVRVANSRRWEGRGGGAVGCLCLWVGGKKGCWRVGLVPNSLGDGAFVVRP